MSGGSFNYAYQKADDEQDILNGLEDYRNIEKYLRETNRHDAADEVLKFVLACETAQRRLLVMGRRIVPLMKAVEWTASHDTTPDAIDNAFSKLDLTKPV